MVSYYRHHIAAWMDGTESLSDGEYRAYHVICELIYLQDGPIVPNEKGIAGRCNQHVLAFRRYLESLVAKGKLALVDGKITNRRASIEIERVKNANPPATPRQPPANPPRTPAQPPQGLPSKRLKNKRAIPSPPMSSLSLSRVSDSKAGEGVEEFLPLGDSSETLSNGAAESESHSLAKWKFDEFWMQYPHKVGKGRARSSFESVRKKRIVSFVDLMLGLSRYAAKDDDRPWCNPATWLNQERWTDEPARNGGSNERRNGNEALAERAFQLADEARARLAAARHAAGTDRTSRGA